MRGPPSPSEGFGRLKKAYRHGDGRARVDSDHWHARTGLRVRLELARWSGKGGREWRRAATAQGRGSANHCTKEIALRMCTVPRDCANQEKRYSCTVTVEGMQSPLLLASAAPF